MTIRLSTILALLSIAASCTTPIVGEETGSSSGDDPTTGTSATGSVTGDPTATDSTGEQETGVGSTGDRETEADSTGEPGDTGTTGSEQPLQPAVGTWYWPFVSGASTNECGVAASGTGMVQTKVWRVVSVDDESFEIVDWWGQSTTCAKTAVEDGIEFDCEPVELPLTSTVGPDNLPSTGVTGVHTIEGTIAADGTATSVARMEVSCEGTACAAYEATNSVTFPCMMTVDRTGVATNELITLGCDALPGLTSVESVVETPAFFYNASDQSVELLWVDYAGALVPFGFVGRYELVEQVTFVTHPWALRSFETDECVELFRPMVRPSEDGAIGMYVP